MKKLLLTNKEVAKILSIDEDTVGELIENNTLKTVEIKPNVVRVKMQSVREYTGTNNSSDTLANIVKPRKTFIIFWLVAILTFVSQFALIAAKASEKDYLASSLVFRLISANIGVGVVLFLIALVSRDTRTFQSNPPYIYRKTWLISLIYFLLMTLPVLNDVFTYKPTALKTLDPAPTVVPTQVVVAKPTLKPRVQVAGNTSNTGSQIECIGPDGKQFKTTMDECRKLNEKWGKPVDYMTNCTYSDRCVGGGGIRYVKKSECDKPCTSVSSGTNNNSTTNNSNKGAFTTNYATNKGTYYCSISAINQLLNYQEETAKMGYGFVQDHCSGSNIIDTICQSAKDSFRKVQLELDASIRDYCP